MDVISIVHEHVHVPVSRPTEHVHVQSEAKRDLIQSRHTNINLVVIHVVRKYVKLR